MIVINLFGAPGAGKSTGAAYIFSKLKMAGINVELVTEFAKDKFWEENKAAFENQAYIFGKQFYRISRLEGKVDVVVNDSPLALSSLYNKKDVLGKEFDQLVMKVFNSYPSINLFIDRVKEYCPIGRFENETESDELARELSDLLEDNGIKCVHYSGCEDGYDSATEHIKLILKGELDESSRRI